MVRLIACMLVLGCGSQHKEPAEKQEQPKRASVDVSFRLDPRLVGGSYGGERWTTGPTFTSTAQPGRIAVVEAKVRSPNARWTSSDPNDVVVSPVRAGRFDRVQITVNQIGDSKLTVTDGDASTELFLRAKSLGDAAVQLEIVNSGETP